MTRAIRGLSYTALLCGLMSCGGEVLIDHPEPAVECIVPIVFDNGFVDQTVGTRTATNELSDYCSTMGVWGWQTEEDSSSALLFSDHPIYYTAGKWTYSPERYWNSKSSYRFHAYAPHHTAQKGGKTKVGINVVNYRLLIGGVKLQGDNLQAEPSRQLKKVFTDALAPHDVDWMVARMGQTATGSARPMVSFTLQHVLAKLNVRIRISDALATDHGITAFTVDTLRIGQLAARGNFAQQFDATPRFSEPEQEWTIPAGAPRMTYLRDDPFRADHRWLYMMESLLIPQVIPYEAEVRLVYTTTFSDAHTEQTTYRVPLHEVFNTITHFVSGNSYTISFLIAPDAIFFDAGTNSWSEAETVTGKLR